jgi:hypothetical protein
VTPSGRRPPAAQLFGEHPGPESEAYLLARDTDAGVSREAESRLAALEEQKSRRGPE